MLKSNKARGCKKSSPLLIISSFSLSLLSCSIYSSDYNSTTNISTLTKKIENTNKVSACGKCDETLIDSNAKSSSIPHDIFNQTHLVTSFFTPAPYNIEKHYTINNYTTPSVLSYERDNKSNKLIEDLATNISNIVKDKNEGSFGLSDLLGILGFIFGFVNFYYARYTDISKELDTYRREFWLKQVLFPGYIDNLKTLITDARSCIEACNGSPVELSKNLLVHFNKVRDGSNFFNSYRNDFNAVIEQLIDDFDDKLADHARTNNNVIDASVLFINLQSFVDEVFNMLDEIYSGEREKVPMFSANTIKRIFFIS